MFTIRCTYRRHSKGTNLKSGMDDDDSNGTRRPYGGVSFITSKLEDVTTHDRPQDDVSIAVMELRDQGSTCLTVIGVYAILPPGFSAAYSEILDKMQGSSPILPHHYE